MNPHELFAELTSRGVRLRDEGGDLKWRAPSGAVTTPLLLALKQHKDALLVILRDELTTNQLRWGRDVRPDLPDTALWDRLLTIAYVADGDNYTGVFGALHFLRCEGVTLTVENGRARLSPGEVDEPTYRRYRDDLLYPRRDAVTDLLGSIALSEAA